MWHTARNRVCLGCSYHILVSSPTTTWNLNVFVLEDELIDDDAKRSREKSVRMLVYDYQIIILFNYDIIFKILCSIILFDLWDPRTRLGGW